MKKLFAIITVASIIAVAASAADYGTTTTSTTTTTKVSKVVDSKGANINTPMTTIQMFVVKGKITSFTPQTNKAVHNLGTLLVTNSSKKTVSVIVNSTTVLVDSKEMALPFTNLVAGKSVTVEYTKEKDATKITL